MLIRLLEILGLRPAPRLTFRIGPVAEKGSESMIVLTDEQKVSLSIMPVTAANNPAKVDGVPQWSVSDPAIITLVVAADGMSAEAITAGPLGTSQVSVSADADLGDGVRTITGILDIEVQAAEAASVGIVAGTPELK